MAASGQAAPAPSKIVYGPEWPAPRDVLDFLAQNMQFVRAAAAAERAFQPVAAFVVLVDNRDGRLRFSDAWHGMSDAEALAAVSVLRRKLEMSLEEEADPFTECEAG